MSMQLIAERYARALAACVEDDRELEKILITLQEFALAYAAHETLPKVLENPTIPMNARTAVFEELLQHVEGPQTAHRFLHTLFLRKRIATIHEVVEVLRKLVDERMNRVRARVTAAAELNPEQRQTIQSGLSQYSGKTILLETRADPEILGGIVVQMNGTVIDGSLRTRLDRIRTALLTQENEQHEN